MNLRKVKEAYAELSVHVLLTLKQKVFGLLI